MPGLCLEARLGLLREMEHRVLQRPRLPDGRPAKAVTPNDYKLLKSLALKFYGEHGLCRPGYRAIKEETGIPLGSITNSTRRLRDTGWLTWTRRLRYVHGSLRFVRFYILAPQPPELRSGSATKGKSIFVKKAVEKLPPVAPRRSVRDGSLSGAHLAAFRAGLAWVGEVAPCRHGIGAPSHRGAAMSSGSMPARANTSSARPRAGLAIS